VSLQRLGTPRPLPAGVGLSAYRIIQEALTNVVKHAGSDARCVVCVRFGDESIDIRVTDDGGRSGSWSGSGSGSGASAPGSALSGTLLSGTPLSGSPLSGTPRFGRPAHPDVVRMGSGHGITGMRERVHLCGGEFSAGPLSEGGFEVTATLPLRAAFADLGGRA
jgi:signal transduction histidine kinase